MTIFSVNSSIKISYNMNWKYGIYEWDWKRKMPTQQRFEGWKKDFLSIPEVKDYEVWVAGGFLEKWKSGHYFEIAGNSYCGWEKGDFIVWNGPVPHAASNIGLEPRYTLQITGIK